MSSRSPGPKNKGRLLQGYAEGVFGSFPVYFPAPLSADEGADDVDKFANFLSSREMPLDDSLEMFARALDC